MAAGVAGRRSPFVLVSKGGDMRKSILSAAVFSGCLGLAGLAAVEAMYMGSPNDRITTYEPEYMSWEDLRSAIRGEAPKAIGKQGKIGIRGHHLFINEPNQGIHVIDNTDPAAPQPLAFIRIPGNLDLAVRGDVLFADSFVDLVALDISALPAVKELSRQVDVFPYDAMQAAEGDVWYYSEPDKTQGVVIGWKGTRRTK